MTVIAGVMALAPSTAYARAQPSGTRGLDYLGAPGQPSAGAASASSAYQCRLPVANRVGAWLCSSPQNGLAPRPSWAPRPSINPFTTTGFCASNGCYYRYSDFTADFDSYAGWWGSGSTILGDSATYVYWTLTGRQTVSKPATNAKSVPTTNVNFSGNLLNAAPGVVGSSVAGRTRSI